MIRRNRDDVLSALVLIALVTFVFRDVVFGGSCFFLRDLTTYYFPTRHVVHDIVARGEFPLWNPYYSGGQPLAANPEYDVFYPPQWLIHLPDFYLGFRLHILLHLYIAALGMYALMRSIRCGPGASIFTAVSFVLGGPLLSTTNLLTILFCLAWLPLTLLFSRRFILFRKPRDLAAASLFLGLEALAFEPTMLLMSGGIVLFYAIYATRNSRAVVASMAIFALAAGIAAIQLVPTLDLLRDTERLQGLSYDMVASFSMPFARIGEFLQPHFVGRAPLLGGGVKPYYESLYLGYAMLVLLVTALVRRDRRTWIIVAGAAAVAILAAGKNTPFLHFAFQSGLPFPLRFPERFMIAAIFGLTIAGGLAADQVLNDPRWRTTGLAVALALGILYAVLLIASRAPLVRADWLAAAMRAFLLLLLLSFLRSRSRSAVATVLVLFAIIDLYPFIGEVAPRAPRTFFSQPRVARELARPADDYRIFWYPEWTHTPLQRAWFEHPAERFDILRNAMHPRLPAAFGFSTIFEVDIDRTNLRQSNALFDAMWSVRAAGRPDWLEPFLALANVDYVAALRPLPPGPIRLREAEPVTFVRVADHPRFYLADEIVKTPDEKGFTQRLANERHSFRAAYVTSSSEATGGGTVRVAALSANRAVIDVRADAPALLVASMTRHRYWRAFVDRHEVPIVPANLAFQAVEIPAGEHRVEFRYINPVIAASAAISLLSLLGCIVLSRFATW